MGFTSIFHIFVGMIIYTQLVPETGNEVEGRNSEGRFVAEGGCGQSASGSGDITDPYLRGQEASNSGVMCRLVAYLQGMRKGEVLQGRGESLGDVVDTVGREETADVNIRRYFGSGKGEGSDSSSLGVAE